MNDTRGCGGFGKVPQQPDFVSLNLPDVFTAPWHRWLQTAIAVGQEQLGEHWLSTYLTSPIWHFALPAHACGSAPAVGTLIPSVDAVGRYFYFSIVHLGNHRPWCAWLENTSWFDAAERAALQALDERVSYSALLAAVEALSPPATSALPAYGGATTEPSSASIAAVALTQPPARDTAALLPLLERTCTQLVGAHALWWTSGSRLVPPVLLLSAGLPDAGQMAAMLDGDWQRWGWSLEQVRQAD